MIITVRTCRHWFTDNLSHSIPSFTKMFGFSVMVHLTKTFIQHHETLNAAIIIRPITASVTKELNSREFGKLLF